MGIQKLKLQNYKRFRNLELDFSDGMNILVGRNDAGKSTVMEAIHLAITGLLGGRYLRNELSQHLFNNHAVADYLKSVQTPPVLPPPEILIEIYLTDGDFPEFEGNGNSTGAKATGFFLKVALDDDYRREYQDLLNTNEVLTLPIEYYSIKCQSFARDAIGPRTAPMKSALIDSSAARYQNGSDVYISRIVRDFLDPQDLVGVAQAYRKMKENFRSDPSIAQVNGKIKQTAQISAKTVTLSAELPSKSDWEDSLVTCVDDVPFHYIGKGEQCLIKTKLALRNRRARDAAVILLEEPENHLTHASLNSLLNHVKAANSDKQVILSTHSSFVANKLGLDSLVLLHDGKTVRTKSLKPDTKQFFEKIAGYDTLRLILSKKAILVEGDSDELIVQKAYARRHGKLPIEDEIDVISVGTSFLRFLEVADPIKQPVVIVTDNDGDLPALQKKYKEYLGRSGESHIKICFDQEVDKGDLKIGNKPFNYNTLEPKLLKCNSLAVMNAIFGMSYTRDEMYLYMQGNKTECALRIFDTAEDIVFPDYIERAIS